MEPFNDLSDAELVRCHELRLHKAKNEFGHLGPIAVRYYEIMAREYWRAIERRALKKETGHG